METTTPETTPDLYEYEVNRFQELLKADRTYAFQRYGCTLIYSLPSEETFHLKKELGWKMNAPLDLYNQGTTECQNGNYKEALKLFEKAMAEGCEQAELFFNMAVIHEEQQNLKSAKELYQKYIDTAEKWDDIPKSLQAELDEARAHLKELG